MKRTVSLWGLVVFLLSLIVSLSAYALPDAEVQKLVKSCPEFAAAEKEILAVWQKLPKATKRQLQKSQLEWIKTKRDEEAAALMQKGYSYEQAYTKVTQDKTVELRSHLQGPGISGSQTGKIASQLTPQPITPQPAPVKQDQLVFDRSSSIRELKTVPSPEGSTFVKVLAKQQGDIEFNSPLDLSFSLQKTDAGTKKQLRLVLFSMPNTVHLDGDGFMVIPPGCRLPFNIHWNQDMLRVVFPLYLTKSQKGSFTVMPLSAGDMSIKWTCLDIDLPNFSIANNEGVPEESRSFRILDQKPVPMMPKDALAEQPTGVYLSPSGEYRLVQYKDRFEVRIKKTDGLILREVGTNPVFSPTSRFLQFSPQGSKTVKIYDLLDLNPILDRPDFSLVAVRWSEGDSLLVLSGYLWGRNSLYFPFIHKEWHDFGLCGAHRQSGLSAEVYTLDVENASLNTIENADDTPTNSDEYLTGLNLLRPSGAEITRLKTNQLTFAPKPIPPLLGEQETVFTYLDLNYMGLVFFNEQKIQQWKKQLKTALVKGTSMHKDDSFTRINDETQFKSSIANKRLFAQKSMREDIESRGIFFFENDPMVKYGENILDGNTLMFLHRKNNFSNQGNNNEDHEKYILTLSSHFPSLKNWSFFESKCPGDTNRKPYRNDIMGFSHFKKNNRTTLIVEASCAFNGAVGGEITNFVYIFDSDINQGSPISLNKITEDFDESIEKDRKYRFLDNFGADWDGPMASKKIFIHENKMATFAFLGNPSRILVIDLKKRKVFSEIGSVEEPWDIEELFLSKDLQWIWQINKSGRFYLYNLKKPSLRLNGIFIDGEWMVFTPEGYYDASFEGAQYAMWYFPGHKAHYTFDQFESQFRRPDIINAILKGKPVDRPKVQIAPPPTLAIKNKPERGETTETSFPLHLTVDDPGNVDNIRIFVNGRPVDQIRSDALASKKETEVSVPLASGSNRITAVAFDHRGFSSNPQYLDLISRAPGLPKPNLYVLSVGVSRYPKLPAEYQLDYPGSDARAFSDALEAQKGKTFADVKTSLLVDEEARLKSIDQALDALSGITENDIAIIFMAGHGARAKDGTFYFLTPDGTFDNPEQGGLSWAILGDRLSKVKGRVLMFLDACHSGALSTETVVPNDELARQFFQGGRGGVMAFSASKGRQSSLESPDIGGGFGIFTYALTQALGPKAKEADTSGNGHVEFMELVDFTKKYVDTHTQGEQTPWLSRKELFGDLPIAAVN